MAMLEGQLAGDERGAAAVAGFEDFEQTNAISKMAENHARAGALHFLHYNFCRPHQPLTKAGKGIYRTPAMAAGLADHVWTVAEIVALLNQNSN